MYDILGKKSQTLMKTIADYVLYSDHIHGFIS